MIEIYLFSTISFNFLVIDSVVYSTFLSSIFVVPSSSYCFFNFFSSPFACCSFLLWISRSLSFLFSFNSSSLSFSLSILVFLSHLSLLISGLSLSSCSLSSSLALLSSSSLPQFSLKEINLLKLCSLLHQTCHQTLLLHHHLLQKLIQYFSVFKNTCPLAHDASFSPLLGQSHVFCLLVCFQFQSQLDSILH